MHGRGTAMRYSSSSGNRSKRRIAAMAGVRAEISAAALFNYSGVAKLP